MKVLCSLITALAAILCCQAETDRVPSWEPGVSIPLNNQDLEENIAWAGEAGFKWLELDMTPCDIDDQATVRKQIDTYAKAAKQAGLKIWSIHIPFGPDFDPSETDQAKLEKCVSNIISSLELARRIGPYHKAILHPSFEPIPADKREAKLRQLKKTLQTLAPQVEKDYQVRLAIECLPRTCLINDSAEATKLFQDNPFIDNCFDVNHLLKENQEHYAKVVGKRIATLHISDYDRINERHWIPGKGVIQWVPLIRQLQEDGYQGPFMFEVTTTPWKDNMRQFYIDLIQSWEKIKSDCKNAD
ncbi:sugar phosphate isomerase/epimerase family protein [Akkermansia sp. N21116]|uniref:sugar phosphate isomerase/epimerase family protein n=1 Tax=Akkermansia sp. N21116 TaxID=3040764 RepID=UPI00244E9192|nr:sugar phosphate isomerase/epimerase family protein [Akkermansia sp. N21116]WPX41264.1 sugar phosphate isomerase/epimerase family protein [Akkermansia sp. N21116]